MAVEPRVCAVVLTGGRSSRMGGRHKPSIAVGGRSVLDRIASTVRAAGPQIELIVAGPLDGLSENLRAGAVSVREDPPFSGPLAGVAAAGRALPENAEAVLLLGGDLPFISRGTIRRLIDSVLAGADVVSCEDSAGHLQYLCSAWKPELFRAQLDGIPDPRNVPLRALFSGLVPQLIDCSPDELRDIDTPDDLRRAITTADGRPVPEALLDALERAADRLPESAEPLTPQQAAEILDFAREVKHAPTAANPAVAAFLAGRLVGSERGLSVSEALGRVLDVVSER